MMVNGSLIIQNTEITKMDIPFLSYVHCIVMLYADWKPGNSGQAVSIRKSLLDNRSLEQ